MATSIRLQRPVGSRFPICGGESAAFLVWRHAWAGSTLTVIVKYSGTGAGLMLVVGVAFLLLAVTARATNLVNLPGGTNVDLATSKEGCNLTQSAWLKCGVASAD
jgi:hypothetical protein